MLLNEHSRSRPLVTPTMVVYIQLHILRAREFSNISTKRQPYVRTYLPILHQTSSLAVPSKHVQQFPVGPCLCWMSLIYVRTFGTHPISFACLVCPSDSALADLIHLSTCHSQMGAGGAFDVLGISERHKASCCKLSIMAYVLHAWIHSHLL